jgi:hypothetical protein
MNTETRGYKTVVYWKAEMLSFDIVPNAEADRVLARYRKKGYHAEVYSKELIVNIAKKNLSKSLHI